MKKIILFIGLVMLCLVGCKKTSNNVETELPSIDGSKTSTVNINGTVYPTVVIGKQTWTSVNYNGDGGLVNEEAKSSVYGKHYTFSEAQSITLPDGWKLPSEADYIDLMKNFDSSFGGTSTTTPYSNDYEVIELMSKETWINADNQYLPTNKSGFNALAGGTYNSTFKYFVQEGYETGFWSSYNIYHRPFMITNEFKNGVGTYMFYRGFSTNNPEDRYCLRFVKNN